MERESQPAYEPCREPPATDADRDPEDRDIDPRSLREIRDKMMDKTLADSYPASDPPSTIPDPAEEDSLDH